MMDLSDSLESFRVGSLPTIFYIPDYLNSQEQLRLLHRIFSYIRQVNVGASMKWKALKNRRLQNWGTICKDLGLYPSPINHVLINEYLPGQGIMPHQDGPVYFPVVAILSLGSPAVMQFTPHQRLLDKSENTSNMSVTPHAAVSVVLMPGSLLVFKDSAYQDYLHGINDCSEHEVDETVVNLDKINLYNAEPVLLATAEDLPCDFPTQDIRTDLKPEGSQSQEALEEESTTKALLGFNNIVKRNGTRVSLTCRLVTKVHKKLFKF